MAKQDANWYKQWFEHLQETPPEDVWEHIADQLDVDEVWNRVVQTLPESSVPAADYNSVSLFKNIASRVTVALILLIILTTPIPPYSVTNKKQMITEKKQPLLADEKKPNALDKKDTTSEIKIPLNLSQQNRIAEDSSLHKMAPDSRLVPQKEKRKITDALSDRQQDLQWPKNESLYQENLLHSEAPIGTLTSQPLDWPPIDLQNLSLSFSKQNLLTNSADSSSYSKKLIWEAGLLTSVNNTWILNNETAEGLRPSSFTTTKATFKADVGLMVRAGNDRRSQLQAEFYLYAQTGQRYQDYYNALYQSKSVAINYQKMQLLYRRRIVHRSTFLSLHVLAGAYLSRLGSATETIGTRQENVADQYTTWDYGLVGGLDTEIPVAYRFFVSPGLRFSYSPNNIYKGTPIIPASFNKTNNLAVGFSLGIIYRINSK